MRMQRTLEASLATVQDSIDLLRSEIAKEEMLLAGEKKQLQEMDKNAKRAEAERKRQTKNVRRTRPGGGHMLILPSTGTPGPSTVRRASPDP